MRWTPGPDELRLPSDDDEPTPRTTRQSVTIFYCFDCLRSHWRGQRDVFVGADQFIHRVPDYDPKTNPDKPPIAPDVYVAFGVANRHRGSYVPWEEGKVPDFVMEVAAPWSREQDTEEKPGIYAEMGVPEFFLYDPDDCLDPPLSGFELCDGKYKQLPKEELRKGIVGVRSKVLELCLCLVPLGPEPMDVTLRLYDPATDELMPTNLELAERKRQLVEDKRQAEAEKAKLEAEKAKLEAEKAKLEAEKAKLEEETAALEAETAKMESEAAEAQTQTKVAELEALAEKLRRD